MLPLTPLEKMHYRRAMREQNCLSLDDWHPWFAWYPVKPFIICGPNKYPKMAGVKMTVGPCIWLRRCWRRGVGMHFDKYVGGAGVPGVRHYEYRRWKRGNKRK